MVKTLFFLAFTALVAGVSAQASAYAQCGGIDWMGDTACISGSTCVHQNDYYFQCVPAIITDAFTTKTSTTKTSTTETSTTKSSTTKTSTTKTTSTTVATPCTVTDVAQVASATASCTSIVLSDLAVPTSTTLNLSKLKTGTTVTFAGKTTFAFTDWDSDLIQIGGQDVTIQGASGSVIDGNGQAWWDGQGSNGGKDKPDHFIVLKTTGTSLVQDLHIQNWPVHCFEITSASGTTITGLTLDNSAGNAPNSESGGLPAAHNYGSFYRTKIRCHSMSLIFRA
ncbi:glycosyl hydrolases family 28-domain-containing protein [Favolaschia claudopus]|uniref:Glycosyl hydrolases family 28-domain-containing protein n=1 Tax=Favolaschia claudopus TaxID=2862362 RepID=A0AAW0BQ20_9AGAR